MRRFFAVALAVGALLGIGILAVTLMRVRFAAGTMLIFAAFLALYVWSLLVGIGLWRGTSRGRRWAPILFATQVPIVSIGGVALSWFTGVTLACAWNIESATMNFNLQFGASFNAQLGSGSEVPYLGVNAFALIAALWLRKRA